PERIGFPYRMLAGELHEAGLRVVVAPNEFSGFEKFRLEAGSEFDVIVVGGVRSGYDVSRALAKGARAVQVGSALATEGPGVFAVGTNPADAAGVRPVGGGTTPEDALQACLNHAGIYHRRRVKQGQS